MASRWELACLLVFAFAGCTTPDPAAPGEAPTTPAPTHVASAGCPVSDVDFCERAVVAANALLARDPVGLLMVAAIETFTCDEMPAGIVPGCRPGAVLTGHGVYSVASKISVVPADAYPSWWRDVVDRVDNGYTDEHGPGRFVVRGVGTCGPADPQRRSYHLAFTAALRGEAGEQAQRWLGSLEFVQRDGQWVVPLVYLDTATNWRQEHANPFQGLACGNVQPWR